MSLNQVLTSMQILLIAAPIAAYIITKRACLSLQRKDREIALHGRETGRLVRLPHGEYIEVHEPLDKYAQWTLVDFKDYAPTMARPNAQGKITLSARLRAVLSRVYFEDRIAPVTLSEIAAENHDHEPVIEQKPKKAVTAKKVAVKK